MARDTYEQKVNEVKAAYATRYDIANLDSPNDFANLMAMIRNQLVIDRLQAQMYELAVEDSTENAMNIKKLNDSINSLAATNIQYEKQLGIDRKTRISSDVDNFPQYLAELKKIIPSFLEKRLVKVYCPQCKIMVGRISCVYDTTRCDAAFQCPQCNKMITYSRQEREALFDIKDSDWRKKYPIRIVQPKIIKGAPELDIEDDLDLG